MVIRIWRSRQFRDSDPGALLFFPADVIEELRQRSNSEEHGPDCHVLVALPQPGDEGAVEVGALDDRVCDWPEARGSSSASITADMSRASSAGYRSWEISSGTSPAPAKNLSSTCSPSSVVP
jgi:hypothetical protein